MMFRTPLVCLVSLILLGALPSPGHTAIHPHAFTFTPLAGVYVFDSQQDLDSAAFGGLGLSYNFSRHIAAEIVGQYLETSVENLPADLKVYSGRFDLHFHLNPDSRAVFFIPVGAGLVGYDSDDLATRDVDGLLTYGLGLKAFLSDQVLLRLAARHLVALENPSLDGDEQSHFQFEAGLGFQFGGSAPASARPIDSDGDGVIDPLDRCAGTPAGARVDADGCPLDTDGDGVPDFDDQCPDTPAGMSVTKAGCPRDSDRDGIPDSSDRCPETPPGARVDRHGCPPGTLPAVAADSDRDGVPDDRDRCAGTPAGIAVDPHGCPDPRVYEGVSSALGLNIPFAPGAVQPGPEAAELLEEAARFIRQHPGSRIRVEGYTDSVGPEAANLKLSQQRAEAVRQLLVNRFGIAAERIVAKGYGEAHPVAENDTPEGRQRNRRVVISILK